MSNYNTSAQQTIKNLEYELEMTEEHYQRLIRDMEEFHNDLDKKQKTRIDELNASLKKERDRVRQLDFENTLHLEQRDNMVKTIGSQDREIARLRQTLLEVNTEACWIEERRNALEQEELELANEYMYSVLQTQPDTEEAVNDTLNLNNRKRRRHSD